MSPRSHEVDSDRAKWATVASTCALFNVRKAARALTQLYDHVLAPCGVTGAQFTVLVAVARAGRPTMKPLARGLAMDRTTLTRNLTPLVRARLLAVERGSDQRSRVISITRRGRGVLDRAFPLWEVTQSKVIAALGETRWMAFLSGLSSAESLNAGKGF